MAVVARYQLRVRDVEDGDRARRRAVAAGDANLVLERVVEDEGLAKSTGAAAVPSARIMRRGAAAADRARLRRGARSSGGVRRTCAPGASGAAFT